MDEEYGYNEVLHSKEVKPVRWNKNWIPFTVGTRSRDFFCLDYEPTVFGNKGQIIFFSIDVGDITFVSKSFELWLLENFSK